MLLMEGQPVFRRQFPLLRSYENQTGKDCCCVNELGSARSRCPQGIPPSAHLQGRLHDVLDTIAELASIAGTWDKGDHGCEGMPRNRYPIKAHDSAAPPSLLSSGIHAEKESHPCPFPDWPLYVHRNPKEIFPTFSAVCRHPPPVTSPVTRHPPC